VASDDLTLSDWVDADALDTFTLSVAGAPDEAQLEQLQMFSRRANRTFQTPRGTSIAPFFDDTGSVTGSLLFVGAFADALAVFLSAELPGGPDRLVELRYQRLDAEVNPEASVDLSPEAIGGFQDLSWDVSQGVAESSLSWSLAEPGSQADAVTAELTWLFQVEAETVRGTWLFLGAPDLAPPLTLPELPEAQQAYWPPDTADPILVRLSLIASEQADGLRQYQALWGTRADAASVSDGLTTSVLTQGF
jgi:hypothetical protein